MSDFPQRIICLTGETVDLLYRLGVEDRIVGVSRYTVEPSEARRKPFVSAFTSFDYGEIDRLRPDLILGFSDLQAEAAAELVRRGHNVLVTNQRTLDETFATMMLIGRIVGQGDQAEKLVVEYRRRLASVRQRGRRLTRRPVVYFEEWNDPLICGIGWVSELIQAAGGHDVFEELSRNRQAAQRVIAPEKVIQMRPEIIVASWCGRRVNIDSIRDRQGWGVIPAVRNGEIYEMESAWCLQAGPVLFTKALPFLCEVVECWYSTHVDSKHAVPTK